MASSILLVACRRSGKFLTGVVAAGAACPSVVVRGSVGGLDTCSAGLLSKFGDGNMQLCEVLQGVEELGVGGRAVYGEGTVSHSESCYRGAINGCSRCEVRNGYDRFVLVDMVGRLIGIVTQLENGAGCGCLQLMPFLVGRGEKFLQVGPGIDVRWLALPYLSVVVKKTSLEHELKSNFNDLGWGIRHVSCGGVVNRIFDLIDQGFERVTAVVGSTDLLVIVLECGGGNVSVCIIKMI